MQSIVQLLIILLGNELILSKLISDRIITGSFDKTAKLWDSGNGKLLNTFVGHSYEIVCVQFDPHSMLIATGSMD